MNTKKWIIATLVGVFFISQNAFAFLPIGMGVNAGLGYGLGRMNTKDKTTVLPRTMNSLALHALPGYKLGPFMVGVFGEYRMEGQSKKASELNGINTKGSGWLVGPGATFSLLDWAILGSFDVLGKYSLSKQTATGKDSSYSVPIGFHLMVQRQFMPLLSGNLAFQWTQYKRSTENDTDFEINGNKFKEWALRLGVAVSI